MFLNNFLEDQITYVYVDSPFADILPDLDASSDGNNFQYSHTPLFVDSGKILPDDSSNSYNSFIQKDRSKKDELKNPFDECESLSERLDSISLKYDCISSSLPNEHSLENNSFVLDPKSESLSSSVEHDINQPPSLPLLSIDVSPQPLSIFDTSKISGSIKNEKYSSLSCLSDPKTILLQIYNSVSVSDQLSDTLDPLKYGLEADFDKNALRSYLVNEYRKVKCGECNEDKYLYNCFCDKKENIFLCVECAANKNGEDLVGLSWEEEEIGIIEDFCKCKRLAHYKPIWSFLSRDKQTGKGKKNKPFNENALKIKQLCFYCRNYKRYEYLKGKRIKGKKEKKSTTK